MIKDMGALVIVVMMNRRETRKLYTVVLAFKKKKNTHTRTPKEKIMIRKFNHLKYRSR